MWTVIGPFDEDHTDGYVPPEKSKLLKPGKEYGVGRKDQLLLIKSKAISKNHALFTVAECSEQQAADPSYVPALTFHNLTDRVRPVERPSLARPRVLCQPKKSMELQHGDIVHLSASIFLRIHLEKICCYYAPGKGAPHVPVKHCASLGIHVVPTLHPEVTHHLTPTYALTPDLATSLISSATLVKPDWLNTVLSSAKAEAGELSSLEENFVLPPTSKFRPTFSPSLPSRLKKYDAWEPNEERLKMFTNHRFVFVGERGAEAPGVFKELVKRGEGDYECYPADGGRDGFRKVLSKARARGAVVVLVAAQGGIVAAVGKEGWTEFMEEARNFDLKFIPPEKLVEAVMFADVNYIDSTVGSEDVQQESVLPDVIPNTIEDEPSVVQSKYKDKPAPPVAEPEPEPEPASAPPPRRRLTRRATSRASSRAPSPPAAASSAQLEPVKEAPAPVAEAVEEAPPPEAPQPRRTLVRRARKAAVEADDSMDVDSARASAEPSGSQEPAVKRARSESVVPPTPARPSRLKRRVGTQAQSTTLFPESEDMFMPDMEEPKHKKFKSLFDESDPDRVAKMAIEEYGSQHVQSGGGGESLTQFEPSVAFASDTGETQGRSGTRAGRNARSGVTFGGAASGSLGAVAEEEEESTMSGAVMTTQSQARGTKRKTQDEDVEMDEDDVPPKSRRRTGEEAQAEPETETQAQTGAQAQKPMSKIVTRVDMAQSHVHVKSKPVSKKAQAQDAKNKKTGEPDRDDAFLKAVASKKRGKKAEDTFDREFNNLRISKPDLEREREDEAFKVLEEFGDDGDVRGNFMVVVEVPLFREPGDKEKEHLRRGEGRLEWQGKPDFKKFKRKALGERRQPIELVVEEDNDLGIGSQYWRGATQAMPPTQLSQPKSSTTAKSTTQKSTQKSTKDRASLMSDSDEDEPAAKPTRAKSRGGKSQSNPPSTQSSTLKSTARTRSKGSQKQALFIDSDIEEVDEKDDDDDAFKLGSDNEVLELDDDDEEPAATLKSRSTARGTQASSRTRSTAKGTTKKAPVVVVDDDSDDGATFKAFGTRSRTRRR
ncbi:hypothetical protein C8Q74DRAFT_1363528 [Fomes fomentarius]|nr:hypothetical protein C8Q74DRAFT_1363528 [Fomes fomentarius]